MMVEIDIDLEDFEIGLCKKCSQHRVTKKGYCLDCYETQLPNNNNYITEQSQDNHEYITQIKDAIDKE